MSGQGYGFGNDRSYTASMTLGAGTEQPATDDSIDVTSESFMREVIEESRIRPVLVDFWAPWCGPCKQLAPVIEKAVAKTKGKVRLVRMNIDQHPEIAGQMGIQSIPAVIAFKDGQPLDGFMGALPESQIEQFLVKITGADPAVETLTATLDEAKKAVAEANHPVAAQLFSEVLTRDPQNAEAAAGMAGLYVEHEQTANALALLEQLPADAQNHPAVTAVRTRIALAEEAAKLGDPAVFEQQLGENPDDLDARFQLALIRNAQGRREEAAEHLLHIVRKDRAFRDDGARQQLLLFFEAWSNADPVTIKGRRRLSTALFS